MLVSKDWLQTYFDKKLPEATRLADLLSMHSFEIEDIKGWDVDDIFDIKVLPDRACYALCHKGIALEISVLSKMKLKDRDVLKVKSVDSKELEIYVKDKEQCLRYVGRRAGNIEVADSPEWLRARLESVGERSINNIVDLANFVMSEINQPMHVFDADKVEGGIDIRLSKKDEVIETLDGKEIKLHEGILIIADKEGPLAIAGIKGGKRAEVNRNTKNIIIESANFNSSAIRLNTKKVDIKTSASKRFESNISPELALEAMDYFSFLLSEECKDVSFGKIIDIYNKKSERFEISLLVEEVNNVLGTKLSSVQILDILSSLGFEVKETKGKLSARVPFERTDVRLKEDVIEEVGRIYGYENIEVRLPPPIRGRAMIPKDFYYLEEIKNVLTDLGFNEVSLYTLTDRGQLEVAYPLADDKKFLREDLSGGLLNSVNKNYQNLPILGLKEVKLFEVGRVFGKNGERVHIAIAYKSLVSKKSRKEEEEGINLALRTISERIGLNFPFKINSSEKGSFVEFDVTELFVFSKSLSTYEGLGFEKNSKNIFRLFSLYPFVLRDVALFVPKDTDKKEIENIIRDISGVLLIRFDLFDIFSKKMEDGAEKISYAYHLVFQSDKKTLTDVEVNEVMEKIYSEFKKRSDWQIR